MFLDARTVGRSLETVLELSIAETFWLRQLRPQRRTRVIWCGMVSQPPLDIRHAWHERYRALPGF
ncbi:hypothetical protein PM022_19910, partial [Halorubrum ezzemoulense]|uniref:hypothetical protein n=1 Tax=Halorubrum ezzemoulense TaxID=337243 RepID=UPI00232D7197